MGLGLFGGGVAAARFLIKRGYDVLVTDLRKETELRESIEELAGSPVTFCLGEHREDDFRDAHLVVKNPAVKPGNPYVTAARETGAVVTSEMNLFFEHCPATIIGITGSNGKTTTAYMTARMLEECGVVEQTESKRQDAARKRIWLGGNLGRPLLDDVEKIAPDDIVVLEMSSFQLMDLDAAGRSPAIAAITNITPNHLDWHKDMAEYVRAKSAIFRHSAGTAVLNAECPITARLASHVTGSLLRFGLGETRDREIFIRGNCAVLRTRGLETTLFLVDDVRLPGKHNLANALCAAALAHTAGATPEAISSALREFRGVEHRLEFVRDVRGIRYYNDSIATTPESTIAAIKSFDCPAFLLLGGSGKGLSYDELSETIAASPHIRTVYVTGGEATRIADAIHSACRRHPDPKRALVVEPVARFADAVERSVRSAPPGAVFLMSPACASFYEYEPGKRFRNFEHRGEYFKELVASLK